MHPANVDLVFILTLAKGFCFRFPKRFSHFLGVDGRLTPEWNIRARDEKANFALNLFHFFEAR